MASITFTRGFKHVDWVDNEDVVQAAGDQGFNTRFHDIEADFDKVSEALALVKQSLDTLGATVNAPVTIGLEPVLYSFGVNDAWSAINWSQGSNGTFVQNIPSKPQAWGVLPLRLPDGVTLVSAKLLGEVLNAGPQTAVKCDIVQELRTPPFTRTQLVPLSAAVATDTPTIIAGSPTYDSGLNAYYALIRATDIAASTTVRIRGLQITYLP
jgi:hypothetical protein